MNELDDLAALAAASPAGYNAPDVEYHELDEATLIKIENGEDDVRGLDTRDDDVVDFIILQPWADAERIGDAIANSGNLRKLSLAAFIDEIGDAEIADRWLFDVFRGLARNRSLSIIIWR